MSTVKIDQFYVRELQPYVSIPSVTTLPECVQRWHSITETRDKTDADDVTLYGSTQLAADLAELAAEAGNVTLAVNNGFSQAEAEMSDTEVTAVANEGSVEKVHAADEPIALHGFCLESSVSFHAVVFHLSINLALNVAGDLVVYKFVIRCCVHFVAVSRLWHYILFVCWSRGQLKQLCMCYYVCRV